jgi:hypothetical protein
MDRSTRCLTLETLGPLVPARWPVRLVVPQAQAGAYAATVRPYAGVRVLACPARGIARTRAWCGQYAAAHAERKFVMIDDDLRFSRRFEDDKPSLTVASPEDCLDMLTAVEKMLTKHAHVTVAARGGSNNLNQEKPSPFGPIKVCVRPLRLLAYQTEKFNELRHGRVEIMEDFDVTLQLIAHGYDNIELRRWTHDQSQTQAAGGCSSYRTQELHERNVRKMRRLWGKNIIELREKVNKTGGDFGKRLEATIYWKKARKFYEDII